MSDKTTPAVNFYILPDSHSDNRHFFVFRLVEKAVDKHLPTLILTADDAQAQTLDKLLWTAEPARFIPHEIIGAAGIRAPIPPVLISTHPTAIQGIHFVPKVVIDLSYDGTPLAFDKIMLVANQHAEILANARMKYQAYKNQGITPSVHKITHQQLALPA